MHLHLTYLVRDLKSYQKYIPGLVNFAWNLPRMPNTPPLKISGSRGLRGQPQSQLGVGRFWEIPTQHPSPKNLHPALLYLLPCWEACLQDRRREKTHRGLQTSEGLSGRVREAKAWA